MRVLVCGFLFIVTATAAELTVAQRNDACYLLRGQSAPEIIADMRRAMDDAPVRTCAARNLREAGAVEALIDALERGGPDTRVAAAGELAVLRDPRALPALGGAALDPNTLVASAAAGAQGDYADPAALPYLLKAAEAPTLAGITALQQAARLRDPAVLPRVRTVLEQGDVASKVVAMAILSDLGGAGDLALLRRFSGPSEPVSSRGRGFGFMPAIDLGRAARTAMARIAARLH